jgi:hypothetical protein
MTSAMTYDRAPGSLRVSAPLGEVGNPHGLQLGR